MQNFDVSAFTALPAARAKTAALALFDAALIDPGADWRGVAFALHAVINRKRGKADAPAPDTSDAGEFAEWADYAPTGKGTAIARGRVTVTFADGWSTTVGMLAGRTAKGRKPWSIGHAVRFAVICYKLAAARRVTGSDAVMYFHRDGNAAGETVALDKLIAAPEILSVISAESAETVDGDLAWNPCEANAFTLDQRAGDVELPELVGPYSRDIVATLRAARRDLLGRLGLIYLPSYALARAAAGRVAALLACPDDFGTFSDRERMRAVFEPAIAADPDAYPYDADHVAFILPQPAEPAPAIEPAPADHETMLQASAIVRDRTPMVYLAMEDFDPAYTGLTYPDRFRLVEDALLAWPALTAIEEPTPVEAPAAVEPAPAPARKPRYRYSSISGRWEPITDAGAPALAA